MNGTLTRSAMEISREELHALVWQTPLSRLGPEFGLDGPRLARICDKRRVPYPPLGYWQKKAVGREPPVSPLPPAHEPPPDPASAVRPKREPATPRSPRTKHEASPPVSPAGEPVTAVGNARDHTNGDGLDAVDALHPRIKAWIVEHRREQKERGQASRRRKRDLWSWERLLLDDLTSRDLYRFRAASTLCHAIEKAGCRVKEAKLRGKLTFVVQGRDIECLVVEKMRRPLKVPEREAAKWTAYPDHHQTGLRSSGFLRASITTWLPGQQPQWTEGPRKPFSALIPEIVLTVVESIPRLVEWEREREEERRRYQKEEQRRYELRRRREIDDRRWNDFRTAAAHWRDKQLLDAFIQELEARLRSEGDQRVGEKTISEWLQWARDRSMELDPFAEGLTSFICRVVKP